MTTEIEAEIAKMISIMNSCGFDHVANKEGGWGDDTKYQTNYEIMTDYLRTLLEKKEAEKVELLARIQEWNQDRVEVWHKTCLFETFDNGRFWEAKDTQSFLKTLELTPPDKLIDKE